MRGTGSALAVAVFFWGMSFVWTKSALADFSVPSMVFIRFASASAVLFVAGRVLKKDLRPGKGFAGLVLLSLFQPFGYFLFETNALKSISTQKASLIAATIPLFMAAFEAVRRRRPPAPPAIAALALSLAGMYLLIGKDVGGGSDPSLAGGAALMFGAVASAVCYMALAGKLAETYEAFAITFYQMLIGSFLLLPLFALDLAANGPPRPTPASASGLAMLVVFSTVAAFLCYNRSIARASPAKAAMFLNAVPVVTMAAGFVLRGETLGTAEATGALLILLSLFLVNSGRGREE